MYSNMIAFSKLKCTRTQQELKDDNSALSAAKQRSEEQYALVQRRVDGLMQDRDSLQQQIDEFKQVPTVFYDVTKIRVML